MPADSIPAEIVRAYDIRGTTPDQVNADVARRIGNAFGQWLLDRGATSMVIGHDTRATSRELSEAAVDGALDAGIEVHAAGLAPTPVIGWTVDQRGLGGGLVVTASHNPAEYNGFKMLADWAQPLLPEEIQHVVGHSPRSAANRGTRHTLDAIGPYLEMLNRRFRHDTGIRLAIDCGNGTTSLTAPDAMVGRGTQVHAIRTTARPIDDIAADPQDPETMRELARVTRTLSADLGISWDGDGDRIGVLDHLGRRYEADWLTAVLARPLLARQPGADILLDLKTSTSAIMDIERRGGRAVSARTGYSFFRRLMREQGIAFGGETSGHIMFGPDYRSGEHAPWIDDGVYAACSLVGYLAESGRTLAEEMAEIEPRPISPELRLSCPDNIKAGIAERIGDWFAEHHHAAQVDRSDGARVVLADGWLHARASNTAPALSLRFEAVDELGYRQIAEQLHEVLLQQPEVSGVDQLDEPPTIGPQPLI